MSINRVPAGVPSGGQFSEGRRSESATAVLPGVYHGDQLNQPERLRALSDNIDVMLPGAKTVELEWWGEGYGVHGPDGEDLYHLTPRQEECEAAIAYAYDDYTADGGDASTWATEDKGGNVSIDVAALRRATRGEPTAHPFDQTPAEAREQWEAAKAASDRVHDELDKAMAEYDALPVGGGEYYAEVASLKASAERRAGTARRAAQYAAMRYAASSDAGLEEVSSLTPSADDRRRERYGMSMPRELVKQNAEQISRANAAAAEKGIGQDCRWIQSGEARRRLASGVRLNSMQLSGPFAGKEQGPFTVTTQNAQRQVLTNRADQKTMLTWSGNHAYADSQGNIIVCDEADNPFVVYIPEETA